MTVEWLPNALCDVDYADTVNAGLVEWEALSIEEKEIALQWGALYIDRMYVCGYDIKNIPTSLQTANALLGGYQAISPIYPSAGKPKGATIASEGVSSTSISGDGASISKSYDLGYLSSKIDGYKDVTAILEQSGVCYFNAGNVKPLMRA